MAVNFINNFYSTKENSENLLKLGDAFQAEKDYDSAECCYELLYKFFLKKGDDHEMIFLTGSKLATIQLIRREQDNSAYCILYGLINKYKHVLTDAHIISLHNLSLKDGQGSMACEAWDLYKSLYPYEDVFVEAAKYSFAFSRPDRVVSTYRLPKKTLVTSVCAKSLLLNMSLSNYAAGNYIKFVACWLELEDKPIKCRVVQESAVLNYDGEIYNDFVQRVRQLLFSYKPYIGSLQDFLSKLLVIFDYYAVDDKSLIFERVLNLYVAACFEQMLKTGRLDYPRPTLSEEYMKHVKKEFLLFAQYYIENFETDITPLTITDLGTYEFDQSFLDRNFNSNFLEVLTTAFDLELIYHSSSRTIPRMSKSYIFFFLKYSWQVYMSDRLLNNIIEVCAIEYLEEYNCSNKQIEPIMFPDSIEIHRKLNYFLSMAIYERLGRRETLQLAPQPIVERGVGHLHDLNSVWKSVLLLTHPTIDFFEETEVVVDCIEHNILPPLLMGGADFLVNNLENVYYFGLKYEEQSTVLVLNIPIRHNTLYSPAFLSRYVKKVLFPHVKWTEWEQNFRFFETSNSVILLVPDMINPLEFKSGTSLKNATSFLPLTERACRPLLLCFYKRSEVFKDYTELIRDYINNRSKDVKEACAALNALL